VHIVDCTEYDQHLRPIVAQESLLSAPDARPHLEDIRAFCIYFIQRQSGIDMEIKFISPRLSRAAQE
jgi:hypothetical protein